MITIDGTDYDVPIIEITRKGDFLDKYAERTEDGKLHRELIGIYFNYTVKFGAPVSSAEIAAYAALWNKLAEAVESHTVVLPDETSTPYSFTAYVAGLGDALRKDRGAVHFWKNGTVNFIATDPAAVPA